MNAESIIGIIAGVFGILTGCGWLIRQLKTYAKRDSSPDIFRKLVSSELSDVEKRTILVKLNNKSII